MRKFLLTTFVLALLISFGPTNDVFAQDKPQKAKKEKCEVGCKKECCTEKKSEMKKKCGEDCTKPCCTDKKADKKKECKADCTKACCSDKKAEMKKKCGPDCSKPCCTSKEGKAEVAAIWNKVCPVKGNEIDSETPTVTYNGKVYGFCCPGCDKKFKANPEKYIKNLSDDGSKYVAKK